MTVRFTESDLQNQAAATFGFEAGREGWQTVQGTFDRTSAGGPRFAAPISRFMSTIGRYRTWRDVQSRVRWGGALRGCRRSRHDRAPHVPGKRSESSATPHTQCKTLARSLTHGDVLSFTEPAPTNALSKCT
jgi:hypothetical protein